MTVAEIAARQGVCTATVRAWLRERGLVAVDGRRVKNAQRVPAEEAARIVVAYQGGATAPQIGREFGRTAKTIREVVRRAGVDMRDDRSTNRSQRRLDDQVHAQVLSLYTVHRNARAVAGLLGIGHTSVIRILAAHGVDRVPAGQVQQGRRSKDGARELRDLMADRQVTSAQVRAWAAATGRAVAPQGIPPRAVVEDYLSQPLAG